LPQLRNASFDPVSRNRAIRQRDKVPRDFISFGNVDVCDLTPRWSGRVKDKVPSPIVGVRAAQLNR
jgi:hypothetical protein